MMDYIEEAHARLEAIRADAKIHERRSVNHAITQGPCPCSDYERKRYARCSAVPGWAEGKDVVLSGAYKR